MVSGEVWMWTGKLIDKIFVFRNEILKMKLDDTDCPVANKKYLILVTSKPQFSAAQLQYTCIVTYQLGSP